MTANKETPNQPVVVTSKEFFAPGDNPSPGFAPITIDLIPEKKPIEIGVITFDRLNGRDL